MPGIRFSVSFILALLLSSAGYGLSLESFLTSLNQMTVSKDRIPCPPPPYTQYTEMKTEQLFAIYAQTTKEKKYDACEAYEQAHALSLQLLEAGFQQNFEQAAQWEITGLQQLMLRKDYDSLISRARDAIYRFKFTQNDPNPNYAEFRFLILRAAGNRVELSGAYYDNSMADTVLDFQEAGSSEHVPQDIWLLRYDQFIHDYPENAHTPEVVQMRRRAIDLMIARQLDVAKGYEKHRRWGNSWGGVRQRMILALSIPGALDKTIPGQLDSPQILEVVVLAIQASEQILQKIQKLQKDQPLDLRAGSAMDQALSELFPLFKGEELEQRDPQKAIDFLQNEIQNNRRGLAILPGGDRYLANADAASN